MDKSLLLILFYILCSNLCESLSCRSLRGDTTWYVMLKPPGSSNFVYADKETPQFMPYDVEINSWTSPVALTMYPVYLPSENTSVSGTLNYFMFNDEVPGGRTNFKMGHTKGAVLFDDKSIVYIITSTPHFPFNDTVGYGYPSTGIKYGQHFFCVTFPKSEFSKLIYQIRMMWPFVYNHKIDDKHILMYDDLKGIIQHKPLPARSNPSSKVETLLMNDNTVFEAYSKNGTFGADIFKDLISTHFNPPMSLYTETWQRGKSNLPSYCSTDYSVKNVVHFKLFSEHIDFKETQDHSKWAVSADERYHYICFGGVNRMSSQFRRGGGMFCFYNDLLWNLMKSGVVEVEECQKNEQSFIERIVNLLNMKQFM